VQSGEASADSALVWARADRPGRLRVEVSGRLDFRGAFFLHSGDSVYADGPLAATVALPGGRTWRNLLVDGKAKVAETLAEYRAQWVYNLLDQHYREFAAVVPQVNQWDDHEVTNNWYPGEILDDARSTEKRVDVLAQRSRRAYGEWVPIGSTGGPIYRKLSYGPRLDVFVLDMRTVKDVNVYADPDRGVLGLQQREWLVRGLRSSRATWKVIAADLPLGLIVPDGAAAQEGVAQGDHGAPKGRELEFATVLRAAHRSGVTGIVFLTADVHYTAAHHYDPARAAVAVFVNASPTGNTSPADGFQHFGEVNIDGRSGAFTVDLRDRDGVSLWSTTLAAPQR
jgi:alkaline phosphatase D